MGRIAGVLGLSGMGRAGKRGNNSGDVAGRLEYLDDFLGAGDGAEALAAVYVGMKGVPGFGAESGVLDGVDAVHGAGHGLLGGRGLFRLADYEFGGGLDAAGGEEALDPGYEGLHLAMEGRRHRSNILVSPYFLTWMYRMGMAAGLWG